MMSLLSKWWRARRGPDQTTRVDRSPDDLIGHDCHHGPDLELESARQRVREIERLTDAHTMAGLEWERDLQARVQTRPKG
jgi:hypothetical protein